MGFEFKFEMNDAVRERMAAGLSFMYTTQSGQRWYIDACLNFPFRQIDLVECKYDAFSLDGLGFEPGFPSLSVCQFALEEGCPQWRGEGWYRIGNEGSESDYLIGPDFLGRKDRILSILDQDIDYASRADVSKIRELKDFL